LEKEKMVKKMDFFMVGEGRKDDTDGE